MAPVVIPSHGAILSELPSADNGPKKSRVPRAIEVTPSGGTMLDDLVTSIRKSPQGSEVTLGKKPAILVDKKPFHLQTLSRPRGFLYSLGPGEDRLKLAAKLDLKDAQARKTMQSGALSMSDPALLQLQQSLSQHQQLKESTTSIFVKDSSHLPPARSGRKALSHSLLKSHRKGLFDQSTRSVPTSPSLGGLTPSRMPTDAKTLRTEAIKVSLIHLLAVRAVSEKYIISTLRCSPTDLKPLLEKYGRESRFDSSKFDLSDRGYKELDVWGFAYSPEDRQAAIDRAVTAYDRLRISVKEKFWQMLLPKEERNKGKVLSKLKLHEGPIERVRTPRINVEPTTETSTQPAHGDEAERNGRLTPANAHAMVRTKSQDQKGNKSSAKDPKKAAAPIAKVKNKSPLAKKASAKKDTPKIKSEEFVHDSDDEMDLGEPAVRAASAKPKVIPVATKPAPKATIKKVPASQQPLAQKAKAKQTDTQPKSSIAATSKKPIPSISTSATNASSSIQKPRGSDQSQKPVAMVRTSSHKRSGSSPTKPSPLGSSPPTNASDLENEQVFKSSKTSSSSASPLINQSAKRTKVDPLTKPPEGNSDRSLKRKANDIDTDVHQHGGVSLTNGNRPPKRQQPSPQSPPSSNSTSSSASPLLSATNIDYSRSFKAQQAKYDTLRSELSRLADPPHEKVEKLQRMYTKLVAHKKEIWRLAKVAI